MIVLLTNDDGIGATGLHAVRRALLELEGVDVRVIAPHVNRSGTARGITTHSPIWVEEIEFDDGSSGFATEGTPLPSRRRPKMSLLPERVSFQTRRDPPPPEASAEHVWWAALVQRAFSLEDIRSACQRVMPEAVDRCVDTVTIQRGGARR